MKNLIRTFLLPMMLFVIAFSVEAASAQVRAPAAADKEFQTKSIQTSPTIQIKERLPDGEYIVVIDNVEQRTITAEHARSIAERRDELDRLKRAQPLYKAQITLLKLSVDLAKKDALLATTQASLERERAEKFQALWDGEHALRLQAEKLMARGRTTKFFDNPYVQIASKIGVPLLNSFLAAHRPVLGMPLTAHRE